jgi:hypothetical protein
MTAQPASTSAAAPARRDRGNGRIGNPRQVNKKYDDATLAPGGPSDGPDATNGQKRRFNGRTGGMAKR